MVRKTVGMTTAILLLVGLSAIPACQSKPSSSAATDALPSAPGLSLGIASVPNLRDLGGYETRDGTTVTRGLTYRSNQLAPISPVDMEKLAQLGLKNDFDLRTEAERTSVPDQLPPGVNNVWLNVLADHSESGPAQLSALLQNPKQANVSLGGGKVATMFKKSYREFVSLPSAKTAFRELFISLGDRSKLPALFHCTTGKDRTGWAAAALLTLLGVPEKTVMEDYLRSNDYILPLYKKEIDAFVAGGGERSIPAAIFGVREEYLEAAFDEMRTKYGTIENYFAEGLGIDATAQTALRDLHVAQVLVRNTPGYNNKIPGKILTPDHVKTPIGDLNFFDGMPDKATVQKLYDNLLFMRGVEAFLSGIPATSIEAIRLGNAEVGATRASDVVIFDKLMDSDPLFLTGNTDTVYAMGILELDRDGPTVVVIPPKCGPGTLDDAWQRFVVDMGAPGLDKGKGGKYLILPPDYEGPLNPPVGGEFAEVDGEKYVVAKSTSYVNWLVLRGFLVDGKPDAASAMFRDGLKIYPLKDKNNQPKMNFISGSEVPFNTVHANTFLFYEELHHIIDREPISLIDPELRGLIASIGIQKGKPFEPDARTKELLTQAVAVGNATARALFFRPMKEAFLYEDSGWFAAFVGGSHEWLKDKGQGGRYLDARTLCFYMGTVNTPAMVNKMVGAGSQYALIAVDENSDYLDGGKNYKLNIPANVPAKDFWSIVVYDPQTRSQLQTGQPFPAKNNKRHKLDINKDGSVDLYFGAKAPEGKETNWIQTVPGKGWFAGLRLYGPLDPWFDKTWRPGEIARIK